MDIQLIGMGGHAQVVAEISKLNGYTITGYYDDKISDDSEKRQFYRGSPDQIEPNLCYHCAIGNNSDRCKIVSKENIRGRNIRWVTLIHPTAVISESVKIGEGCLIGPLAVIQPYATIGNHTIINSGAIIEHDCQIGNFVHVAPGSVLCGEVCVNDLVFVGARSVIIPNTSIDYKAVIGAGTTIYRDVIASSKVVGFNRIIATEKEGTHRVADCSGQNS